MHGLTDKEADDVWVRVGDHDNSDPGDTEVEHQQRMFLEFLNFDFGINTFVKLLVHLSFRLEYSEKPTNMAFTL